MRSGDPAPRAIARHVRIQRVINGIAVEGLTIKTTSLTELAFEDDGGEATILFVPIRPGKFSFWVEGYQTRGMAGDFVVE